MAIAPWTLDAFVGNLKGGMFLQARLQVGKDNGIPLET
jgi:hypothetical protein